MQNQEQMKPPAPLDMEKFLQSLNMKLANMKRQNAQQLGVLVQTQSESIGRQHDTLVQEIAPLIQEVGRLLNENEALKKQLPKPPKEIPQTETPTKVLPPDTPAQPDPTAQPEKT